MFTSWMSGMAVQPSFLSVAPIFLSSDDAVLCIVFFFRRAVPLPPVRESAATPPKRRAIIFSRASLMSMAGIDAGGATCGKRVCLGGVWRVPVFIFVLSPQRESVSPSSGARRLVASGREASSGFDEAARRGSEARGDALGVIGRGGARTARTARVEPLASS